MSEKLYDILVAGADTQGVGTFIKGVFLAGLGIYNKGKEAGYYIRGRYSTTEREKECPSCENGIGKAKIIVDQEGHMLNAEIACCEDCVEE